MNPIVASILTAAITSTLTTAILIFKERLQSRGQQQRQLTEKKLLEIYNKLYVINLKYFSLLIFEQNQILVDIDDNGEERFTYEDIISDYTYWDLAIKEATEVVRPNIHLLEYEDVSIWHEFEMGDQKEAYTQDEALEKYDSFKRFLKQTKKTYGNLYNEYHYQTRVRKNQRKKKYKTELKSIKQNPFYSKTEKKTRIKALQKKKKQ